METPRPRPRPPRERLASLKDPRETRMNRSSPRPQRPTGPQCPDPNCTNPQIEDVGDHKVCINCGTMISDSNIVSEVTFGETSTGAAVVQGGFVGEGQRHAKSLGSAFRRAGGMESRELTESFGRDEIRKQANALSLNDNIADQAFGIYKLAATNNFIQGRRIRTVAAVCLYVACRRDVNNQTLLMDFSELIQVNVFKLGQTYQDLKKDLWLGSFDQSGIRPVVEVENLIMKFARKLEFGNALMKVAEDAAKLVKRMKRDWMVTGRRPAGLCGACIILAARMNNFRRTVREVVYVVKVADMTVSKRLEEFKRTTSGDLTVDQFREFGLRLKESHDPPAVYEAKMREEKKKRKLERLLNGAIDVESDSVTEAASVGDISTRPSPAPLPSQPRRDADGFAIPHIPVDPSLLEADKTNDTRSRATSSSSPGPESASSEPPAKKQKRGRLAKPKPTLKAPLEITEDDLLVENALEEEINTITTDPSTLAMMEDAAFADGQSRAKALADQIREKEAAARSNNQLCDFSDDGDAPATTTPSTPRPPVSVSPDIGEDEFADDPEVANCLLSEVEQAIKERIWVTHNEDWLRAQQAKLFKKTLEEAAGGGARKQKRPRNKGRMGDGSVLEGGSPVDSPAEANRRMLEKRSKGFSKHINYEKLNEIYKGIRGSASGGPTTEGGTTEDGGSVVGSEVDEERGAGREEEEDEAEEAQAAAGARAKASTKDNGAKSLPTPPATQMPSFATAGAEAAGIGKGADDDDDEEGDEDDYVDDDDEDIQRTMHDFGIDDGAGYDDEDDVGFDGYDDVEE